MSNKLVTVTIAACVGESDRAWRVIYTHFEDPGLFTVVWIPKSSTVRDGSSWRIPLWLKNKIAKESRRYRGRLLSRGGIPKYAYGFDDIGYYTAAGTKLTVSH